MLLKTTTSKNLSSNILFYVAKLCIGVAAMPVCLRAFGEEIYGLYLLGFGLSASLTAFDLGAAKSVFRYTVEYRQDNDINKYSSAMSGAGSLNIVAAMVIGLILFLLGFWSESLFHLSEEAALNAVPLFVLAGINASILTIDAFPQQLLQGYNLFNFRNRWQYIPLIGNAMLLIYAATFEMSIIQFALCNVALAGMILLIDLGLVMRRKLLKQTSLFFTLRKTSSTTFSNWSFAHAAISFLSIQADRLILGSVLNVSAVTTYSIITKPYFVLRGMVAAAHPAFQPGLSALYLSGEKDKYVAYSKQVISITFLGMLAVSCWIGAFINPLLEMWLNSSAYAHVSVWGILSLSIACITMLYTPHYRTLTHSAELKYLLRFSYIGVPLNVIISIVLSYSFGFQGVIIGTVVQVCMEGIYIYYLMRQRGFKQVFGFNNQTYLAIAAILCIGVVGSIFSNITADNLFQLLCTMVSTIFGLAFVLYFQLKEKLFSPKTTIV